MSRTRHHRGQRAGKCGLDFGGRYKHNKEYGGGSGPDAKNAADSERRREAKKVIKKELDLLVD